MAMREVCREWQLDHEWHYPEQRLCAAVLLMAVEDVLGKSCYWTWKAEPLERLNAYAWLFVWQEAQRPTLTRFRLSAQFCCQALNYRLPDIRARLWQQEPHVLAYVKGKYQKEYGTA